MNTIILSMLRQEHHPMGWEPGHKEGKLGGSSDSSPKPLPVDTLNVPLPPFGRVVLATRPGPSTLLGQKLRDVSGVSSRATAETP